MKRVISLLFALTSMCYMHASLRDVPELHQVFADIPLRIGGYIDAEFFWDTRQVVGAAVDEFLLYPEPQLLDPNCDDINAKGQYASVAIQSRIRMEMDGPDIRNASSMGVIEGDFFGKNDIDNIFRLRHAYFKLTWSKANIIAGQTWHPLYIVGVDPRTVSFNAGVPIETFARSPQVRLTYTPNECIHMFVAASTQLNTVSDGPIGPSSTYLRNSAIPRFDIRIDGFFTNGRIGADIDWKLIQPRLQTNKGFKTREQLNSVIATVYGRLSFDSVDSRTKIIFYQNATDLCVIGGYAVSCINTNTDLREYTNLNGIGVWNDTEITKSEHFIPGWFIGFAKNLGARTTITQTIDSETTIYGTGTDIDYLFRISPRVLWKINNFTLGVEIEYTRAAFGTIDCDGDVIDTCPVGNTRLLASLFYYF